jgi:hypothetical protein
MREQNWGIARTERRRARVGLALMHFDDPLLSRIENVVIVAADAHHALVRNEPGNRLRSKPGNFV